MIPNPDWMLRALCRDHPNPELWFPPEGDHGLEGKAICVACPVQDECYDYALRIGVRHGIWGGESMSAYRRRLWRKGA